MKAKDLIKLLQTKNPEAEVWLRDSDGEKCVMVTDVSGPPGSRITLGSVLPLGQGHYPWE